MQQSVLVVSQDLELIREIVAHFEQSNDFRVNVAGAGREALNVAINRKADAVIIDSEGFDIPLSEFINEMSSLLPKARILLFPPENNPLHPELAEITIHAILQKPFSTKELDAFLNILFGTKFETQLIKETVFMEDNEGDIQDDDLEPGDLSDFLGENEIRNLDSLLESLPPPDPEDRQDKQFEEEHETPEISPVFSASDEILIQNKETNHNEIESKWIRLDANELPDIPQTAAEQIHDAHQFETSSDRQEPDLPNVKSDSGPSESESDSPSGSEFAAPNEEPVDHNEQEINNSQSSPADASFDLPESGTTEVKSVRFEYYCLLIPNDPQQYLAREISDRLGFILPQIHISQGWRVTSLSIRPMFLMWQISLPGNVSPIQAVTEIRKRTSSHFYSHFPEFFSKNQSNDFWAPGYLILSGPQGISNTLINEFIRRTRSEQQETSG